MHFLVGLLVWWGWFILLGLGLGKVGVVRVVVGWREGVGREFGRGERL